MKNKILFILAVLLICVLCACKKTPEPDQTPTTVIPATTQATTAPTVPTEPTETTEPPVYVYPGAITDLLEPVDLYSEARSVTPEFVMIHFMSAVVNHRDDPYHMSYVRSIFVDYEISVHYLIDRDGTIYCYVPENLAAYHAGRGEYGGDERYTNMMNHYAIGIELLAIGSRSDMDQYLTGEEYDALTADTGFTDAQYESLRSLVADICQRNGIPMDRDHVIGHEDYSPSKTDPGELFDWDRLLTTAAN